MTTDIGNYAKHAFMWDLYGPARTEEFEHWREYAQQYGQNVLIPMCAVGKSGAYLAERGFNVTAFDITPEMIAEGQKRYGHMKNLKLFHGDIRDFSFDILPADFCYCVDIGHLQTIGDIINAVKCIGQHLRKGSGFVIETALRSKNAKTEYFPPREFDFGEVAPGINMRKVNNEKGHYDGENGRHFISQDVYIEDTKTGSVEMFDHSFYLQFYFREEWVGTFDECGFEIKYEYKNREKEAWREGDGFWIVEAVKK